MGFGSFDSLCAQSALPLCSLLGAPTTLTSAHNPLILPNCVARSIEVGNTIIFEGASDFAHIAALFMTAIMIFHVRSKFTAVGRREILTFFYIYLALTCVSLVLDAGVMDATNTGAFPWFVAVQNGLISALCTSLLVNGFVGFQLYEDGTTLSVWLLRVTCLGTFALSFLISLLTVKNWAGLGPENTTGLFVVVYILNAACLAVYLVMQVILVANTLQDRWPLGDIAFGVFFFVMGQIILYVLSEQICEGTSHYLDGLFFATVCNLLAVMMVYKFWDSITQEDLEFSVGTKQGNWEVKEPFLTAESDGHLSRRTSFYGLDAPTRASTYDTLSLDYRPQSQHQGRLVHTSGPYVGSLNDSRQSFGDVRKSVNISAARRSSAYADSYHDNISESELPPRQMPMPTPEARYGSPNGNGYKARERRDRHRSQGPEVLTEEFPEDRYESQRG